MNQKQEFLGGLIGGILVKKGVEFAVDKALNKAAKSPSLSLDKKDVPAVKQIVTHAVEEEVRSRVEHATNSEPAYQSRVAQGSVASILGAAALIAELWTNGVPDAPTLYAAPVTILVGAAWALYGRFVAKKPFGA